MFIAFTLGMGIARAVAGESFLPPNQLHWEDDQKGLSAMSEVEFRQVIAEATRPWEALAEVHGGRLVVEYLWNTCGIVAV